MRSAAASTIVAAALLAACATALAQKAGDYAVGAGDVLKITVFQNPDLATETRVSEAGTITFPLIGTVEAGGQSTTEIGRAIAQKLRDGGFVNRPQVNVVVLQFRSLSVSVLGQVNRPGKYPLEQSQNRLTEVLALAGGITTLGSDVVTIITSENGLEKTIDVDVPETLRSVDKRKDIVLKAGDVIYVARYPVFYIHGEVQRPGQYRLERDMTVMQALAVGGGLTLRGTQRGLQLTRKDASGTRATRDVAPGEEVRSDDVLFVRESMF